MKRNHVFTFLDPFVIDFWFFLFDVLLFRLLTFPLLLLLPCPLLLLLFDNFRFLFAFVELLFLESFEREVDLLELDLFEDDLLEVDLFEADLLFLLLSGTNFDFFYLFFPFEADWLDFLLFLLLNLLLLLGLFPLEILLLFLAELFPLLDFDFAKLLLLEPTGRPLFLPDRGLDLYLLLTDFDRLLLLLDFFCYVNFLPSSREAAIVLVLWDFFDEELAFFSSSALRYLLPSARVFSTVKVALIDLLSSSCSFLILLSSDLMRTTFFLALFLSGFFPVSSTLH